ncbi:class I SAM-dependent methyltransferase [Brachybacterium alimentarium]|uniref:Methyltransferase domain-containing protein n=1 Tax=Brachybacterium alimentarium TaxID=47845 RepID=A0A2A3YIB7_9MICO|nr:class I SAM-dependent methyltransferase [Brachybacterium alimentarium]PCC39060.1 hypothetical protein CIK66_10705 [Brachybacterium alimentarium]
MDSDERYAIYGRPFGEQPNAFVQQVMDDDGFAEVLGSASRILCPGDGYGRNGLALAQRGHRVLGLDISATATRDARARAMETAADATFLTADLSGPPYPLAPDDVFDAVVSVWFRLPERSARKAWNRAAIGHLTSRGALVVVTGGKVTTIDAEIAEWGNGIAWEDHSTAEEIRLIGQLVDCPHA